MTKNESIPAPERSKEETGVRIKPLEWPDAIRRGQRVMSGRGLIQYTICHYGGSEPDSGVVYRWAAAGEGWHGPLFSYEDAIAAAQADYEQRIKSALETPPLHKKGEVEWRHQCASSGFHDHDGCSCSEEELRARFAAPVPVPVTITNRMVNIAWAEFNAKTHATHLDAMRAALAAALKPGEQG